MPVYFEPRKRKNHLPAASISSRLILITTVVLSAGLLAAGIMLFTTATVTAPAVEQPQPFADETFGILVEAGSTGLAAVEALVSELANTPDMPPFEVRLLYRRVDSEAQAFITGKSLNARMVIWTEPKYGGIQHITLIQPENPDDAASLFKIVWLPQTFAFATDVDAHVPAQARLINGVIAYESGRYAQAETLFNTVRGVRSSGIFAAPLALLQGNARFQQGDYTGAMERYDAGFVFYDFYDGLDAYLLMNRASAYYQQGNVLAAYEDYTKIQTDHAALNLAVTYNRALLAYRMGLYLEARNYFRRVQKSDAHYRNVDVYLNRVNTHLKAMIKACDGHDNSRVADAIKEAGRNKCRKAFGFAFLWANQAVQEDASCYHYNWRGHINLVRGDHQAAFNDFDRVLAMCGGDYYAHIGRGYSAGMLGNQAVADYDYHWTTREDPHSDYLTLWGLLYQHQGNAQAAGEIYWKWMTRPAAEPAQPAAFTGQTVTLAMGKGQIYLLPVEGKAGQTLSVVTGVLNPYRQDTQLVVLDSAGNVLAGHGDRGLKYGDWNAQLAGVSLPADGTYTIAVAQFEKLGDMRVRVTYGLR